MPIVLLSFEGIFEKMYFGYRSSVSLPRRGIVVMMVSFEVFVYFVVCWDVRVLNDPFPLPPRKGLLTFILCVCRCVWENEKERKMASMAKKEVMLTLRVISAFRL